MRSKPNPEHKLTIAHLMPWSGVGGVEVATLRMVEATRNHVHNIAFCLSDALELQLAFGQLGVETFVYDPPEPSLRHGARYYRQSQRLAKQLRDAGVGIVHCSDEKAAYHNSLAALLARTEIVCHLRGNNSSLSLRQRLCLRPVDSFIFVSQDAMRTFGMSLVRRDARVIYDAITLPAEDVTADRQSARQELGIDAACVVVGMVARVAPVKDYFTLAAAARQVISRHPNVKFLIIGDNSLVALNREHYAKVADRLVELRIADRFIFTGHRTDVSRLIAAIDIGVLCSHREGFGLAIIECMAMRKPVVATAVGGILEIVRPGINGYLHQHENSDELAAAILSLIEAPEEIRRLGDAAREDVRQRFSGDRFTTEIVQAYRDVLRQGEKT